MLKRSIVKVTTAVFAASFCAAASPALADTSADSAATGTATAAVAADVAETARDSKLSTLSGDDRRFRELFASWTALDERGPGVPIAVEPAISVPSLIPVMNARVSSNFGLRRHPVLGRQKQHKGIDFAAPTGTPVYATADGMVGRADWFSSYGLFISIDHGAELETRYAHLSRLAVAAGQQVEKGDLIGYVGSTGRSTGPHLHYEVRVEGKAVNPAPYMVENTLPTNALEGRHLTGMGGR
ncbi:MAG: M23 family metallopeptidase [Erythrobacter sp.]|jgi:murein DD-endopeptidase MepM/ murein hydrolase activator NlpD|nr:M23 family metallopeptidase [Erythrobacter sp.]